MQSSTDIKSELRKAAKQKIRALRPTARRESDRAFYKKITENLDIYASARTLFCFVGTPMEIDTSPIILHALGEGKTVAVPLCIGPGILEAHRISSLDELKPGAMDILEPPSESEEISRDEIDLAIVPCLSCDRDGNRLGYGLGYYDIFMREKHFPAFALCREELIADSIPTQPWDVPVDAVVTEHGIYTRQDRK
jgi:5-formyltetrahydrofolate cyclo-ligase